MIEIEVDTSRIIFTDDCNPTYMTNNENETQFVEPEVEKHRENIRTILHCTFTDNCNPTYMTNNENETQFVKPEVEKHRENIRTILHCTNATPIGRYGILGYTCCYCSNQYTEAKDLKVHTIESHDEEAISNFMSNYTMLNYIVKLDITELRCAICLMEKTQLQEMIDHLTIEHEQFFHTDVQSHIVPFRFDSDRLHCTECPSEYRNFKILLEHMNTHFGNHICEVCKAGFVNKRMLQAHMYRHKTGVFQCGYCTKVFDTRVKVKVHERVVHMYVKKRPKCNVCEKKFKDFNKMIKHEEVAHGVVREFSCKVCRKLFTSERALSIHTRFHCTSDVQETESYVDTTLKKKRMLKTLKIEAKPTVKKLDIIEIKPRKLKVIKIQPSEELDKQTEKVKWLMRGEVDNHKDNIRIVLSSSNATPIGRYGGIGYGCCFCHQQYPIPNELKEHTMMVHNDDKINFMENVPMPNYIVKLDITDLKCELCKTNIDNLDELTDHLQSIHGKQFHKVKNDHVLPFKFESDFKIKCVICKNEHNNFKVLLEHMNTHFRNYICDVCGGGFVNKRILQSHAARHKTGEFTCSYCFKVFNTHVKKKDHERAVHITCSMRSKCGYCGEKFTDYTKKNNHEVKVHGAKPIILKCQACDKTFDNQRSLTVHTKTYHLMEKRISK